MRSWLQVEGCKQPMLSHKNDDDRLAVKQSSENSVHGYCVWVMKLCPRGQLCVGLEHVQLGV